MANPVFRAFSAQILTGALCLAIQTLAQPVPDCCQRMDGNRSIVFLDTQTVKLHEVLATLVVDSVRSRPNPNKRFTYLRVLAKSRVDTSLFSDVLGYGTGPLAGKPDPLIEYSPSDFPDTYTDSLNVPALTSGDTLKNVFVLQLDPGNGRIEWHLSGIKCKFLTEANPPFPFSEALGDLNRFMDSAAIADGGTAGTNSLKLGPVFIPGKGDIGLQITATHDGNYWYVTKLVGSGDCPAGCTEHTETLYRMDAQGNVLIVSVRDFFALCWASEIRRGTKTPAAMSQGAGCFTADGRKVDQNPSTRPSRTPLLLRGMTK